MSMGYKTRGFLPHPDVKAGCGHCLEELTLDLVGSSRSNHDGVRPRALCPDSGDQAPAVYSSLLFTLRSFSHFSA